MARKLFVSLRSESPKSFSSVFDTNTGALKLHMFPEARNEILIRLENVADLLDGSIEDQTIYFDIDKFAADFYSHVNGQPAE